MFIDIHAHAYRRPVPFPVRFPTAEQVLERYDEAGIEKGVLLPVVSPEVYLPQANEDILEMAERYPDRFIPFCNIDPRALTNSVDAPLDRLLKHYRDQGCRGIGEVMPNVPLRDPMVQNLFKHAQDAGLPVTFDGSDQIGGDFGLYDDPGMPQLEHTLQRFPQLVILAHGLVFWTEIGRLDTPAQRKTTFRPDGAQVGFNPPTGPITEEGVAPKLLRRYPNLYGDLSARSGYNAISRDPEFGIEFMEEFQDRLCFGTDIAAHFDERYQSLTHAVAVFGQWHIGQVFIGSGHENSPGLVPQIDNPPIPAQIHLCDGRPRAPKRLNRRHRVVGNTFIDGAETMIQVISQGQAFHIRRDGNAQVTPGQGLNIRRILTLNRIQEQRRIGHGACQRAEMGNVVESRVDDIHGDTPQ